MPTNPFCKSQIEIYSFVSQHKNKHISESAYQIRTRLSVDIDTMTVP